MLLYQETKATTLGLLKSLKRRIAADKMARQSRRK